ncbi:ABC transporter permease [Iodobacter fluviatilis]|uniref:Osmoprotectant transport system permease protein n=1 Tax=Iodobacter fluviatilis TaxID=537 RepID=A0A377QAG9_9NEIS|nr:ABC transporter permease [Iodobacter fluviatilis]TCU81765.1 osmoprotectant transport system permease protein [Iodobacter fluviatilis]STQ91872.1 Putative osmoprotectant uptake system permease protein yehW [Iodobacter fluviatilis]
MSVHLKRGLFIAFLAAIFALIQSQPMWLKTYQSDLIYLGQQHLRLAGYSMLLALIVGLPAGILLSRSRARRFAEPILQLFNIGNTLPPLAVLALAMVLVGIGDKPAIIALFLASLLPIVRNTYAGLCGVSPALLEAARGLGMTPGQSLWHVELPNAAPVILVGIRLALVINVGTVPLTFLIGASSYGELIFPGIFLNNQTQLLVGAGATAIVALTLDQAVARIGHIFAKRASN